MIRTSQIIDDGRSPTLARHPLHRNIRVQLQEICDDHAQVVQPHSQRVRPVGERFRLFWRLERPIGHVAGLHGERQQIAGVAVRPPAQARGEREIERLARRIEQQQFTVFLVQPVRPARRVDGLQSGGVLLRALSSRSRGVIASPPAATPQAVQHARG